MTSNDAHVIIYKVLAYLYSCMKDGKKPDSEMLVASGVLFGGVPESYWSSLWIQILDRGYVKGIGKRAYNDEMHAVLIGPEITLEGIEYMQENSMMKKALSFLKEAKSILPFV